MYCSECGIHLPTGAKFCPQCGHSAEVTIVSPVQTTEDEARPRVSEAPAATTVLGTKWLKFWTYFSLPVGAIVGLLMVFAIPEVGVLSVAFAALVAALQIAVAFGLHYRKTWAWQWNWVIIVLTWLSIAAPISAESPNDFWGKFLIGLVLGAIIWMWPNSVYWNKRKSLFT